jgi:hypothetical protein
MRRDHIAGLPGYKAVGLDNIQFMTVRPEPSRTASCVYKIPEQFRGQPLVSYLHESAEGMRAKLFRAGRGQDSHVDATLKRCVCDLEVNATLAIIALEPMR